MPHQRPQPIKAALWMTGAIASFTSMAIAGRQVSAQLDTFEIMLYRSIVGFAIVVGLGWATGAIKQVSRRHIGLHLVRNIGHFSGQNLWFYAITVLPLAQVFALEFTSPLWVILLSPLVLAERMTAARITAGLIGFAGVLLVTRPFGADASFDLIYAALAAIGFALSAIFTKRLTRTETTTCILFYLTLMQAAFGLVCAGIDGDIALPTTEYLPWLGLIACAGLLAHFCLTTALRLAPATVVVPVDFIRLPVIAIVGMVFYNEGLDIFVLIGASVIFAGNYYNIWQETRAIRSVQ
jgi:drug/metabolite transporter (DMT)-like permease